MSSDTRTERSRSPRTEQGSKRPASHKLAALAVLLLSTGCAGYVNQTADIRKAYEASKYDRALALITKERKKIRDDDRLLYLLDRGMVQHAAGLYGDSILSFAEADRLSQQLDRVSISEETNTLVTNETARAYKGEDFEKLMISVLQALNYASLGNPDDALVEVRRMNERLQKMVTSENKPYEQLAIARYLSGTLYEDRRAWDDAFVDYEAAYKLQPELGGLASALLRVAKLAGREDRYRELKSKYPQADDVPLGPKEGEVLVVVEAGLSPEKKSKTEKEPDRKDAQGKVITGPTLALPYYEDRWKHAQATVTASDRKQNAVLVTNLANVSKEHLNDRVDRIRLQAQTTTALKDGVADGVGKATKSDVARIATSLVLGTTTYADTRSWLSLPAEFQLARVKLPEGKQRVLVSYGGASTPYDVTVKPNRVSLLVVRRY